MVNSVLCLKKSSVKQSISEILPYRNGCAPFHRNRKNPATSSQVYGFRVHELGGKTAPSWDFSP